MVQGGVWGAMSARQPCQPYKMLFGCMKRGGSDHDIALCLSYTLQIMYLRHGRAELDAKLEEVFGTSDLNSGKTLGLTEFLNCLHQNQVKQLLNRVTAKNYKPQATGKD